MTDRDIAAMLRLADFALDRASISLVAFVAPQYVSVIGRDFDRCVEVRKQIAEALKDLPPPPPLTPEQDAECRSIVAAALARLDSQEDG